MGIREHIDRHPSVLTSIAFLSFVAAVVVVAWSAGLLSSGPDLGPRNVYYWDLADDTTFVASNELIAPIDAPSGEEGVRAYLYSCGACDVGQWFGYLEKQDVPRRRSAARTDLLPGEAQAAEEETGGAVRMIRSLEGDEYDWMRADSDEGVAFQRELMDRCGGEPPVWCAPKEE